MLRRLQRLFQRRNVSHTSLLLGRFASGMRYSKRADVELANTRCSAVTRIALLLFKFLFKLGKMMTSAASTTSTAHYADAVDWSVKTGSFHCFLRLHIIMSTLFNLWPTFSPYLYNRVYSELSCCNSLAWLVHAWVHGHIRLSKHVYFTLQSVQWSWN